MCLCAVLIPPCVGTAAAVVLCLQTYAEIMKQKQLEREQANTLDNIAKAKEAAAAAAQAAGAGAAAAAAAAPTAAVGQKRRNRWDQSGDEL